MPGLSTFTTASSPSRSVTAWTCATDAAARGSLSNVLKAVAISVCSSCSIISTADSPGKGATLSWRRANSSAISSGRRSLRVDSNWPNFIGTGPRDSKARRNRSALGASPDRTVAPSRRFNSPALAELSGISAPKRCRLAVTRNSRARLIQPLRSDWMPAFLFV